MEVRILLVKKPVLRVSKWLGEIPVEAYCAACSGIVFRARGSGHRPNGEEYRASLQAQFEAHCREAHSSSERPSD